MAFERSAHEMKFDRQMRLWGSHGQMNLETAHLCIIGSGATASEALKNLVLPNVGRFTLIDDHITTNADKNSNFFVDLHSVGRPRAEVVKDLMLEMNADVKGEAVVKSARTLLASSDLSFFDQFSIVLISDPTLPMSSILPLSSYLYTKNIPLVIVQSKGYIATARLQIREHTIIESHPGNDRYDLYIHPEQIKHWPALQDYVKQFKVYKSDFSDAPDAPKPDGEEHAHIPYIAILAQEIARWTAAHGGKVPSTYDEKQAFKASIRASAWNGEEGNFDEAIEYAHRAYELPKPDRYVQAILDDASVSDTTVLKESKFWCMVRAVKEFLQKEGHGVNLPVSQNLPDMHCKTAYYVTLKELFQKKSEEDFRAVQVHLNKLLAELGLAADDKYITPHELNTFVRNIRTLRVIRTSSLSDEYTNPKAFRTEYVKEIIEEEVYEEEDDSSSSSMSDAPQKKKLHNPKNIHWYLGLRACEAFFTKHGRVAGTVNADLEKDYNELVTLENELVKSIGLDSCVPAPDSAVVQELTRSGACEPHVTGAFMGGIAAQIVLKVLLKQYVPMNNTFIWNGLMASSNTYQL